MRAPRFWPGVGTPHFSSWACIYLMEAVMLPVSFNLGEAASLPYPSLGPGEDETVG